MARTVNPQEYTAKREEILDAAQRLVLTVGYAQMSIQDILRELNISSGAFHHYFESRSALLEALTERMQGEVNQHLRAIVDDPHLPAREKLQRFLTTLDQMRVERKTAILKLLRIWYTDDNALVRLKVDRSTMEQRAPLVNRIVAQGIREGVFTSPDPEQAGDIILSLLHGMSSAHAKHMLAEEQDGDFTAQEVVRIHAAYMGAIERVLGAEPAFLSRIDAEAVRAWLNAKDETEG